MKVKLILDGCFVEYDVHFGEIFIECLCCYGCFLVKRGC